MVNITKLVRQIRDLGQIVLKLESGLDLMQRVKNKEVEPPTVGHILEEIVRLCISFDDVKKSNLVPIPQLREGELQFSEYVVYLALSLLNHDLKNNAVQFSDLGNILNNYSREIPFVEQKFNEQWTYLRLENLRIILALIPYVATGDKRFLVQINVNNIPNLLENLVREKTNFSYDFNGLQTISSDQYFAILQFVRNAVRAIEDRGTMSQADNTIEIKLQYRKEYLSLIVKDGGIGISQDALPKIFRGHFKRGLYSTALQVVKRILDLRNGHAEVISTQSGKPTFKYDTRTDTVSPMEQKPQGSTFILYFPRTQ